MIERSSETVVQICSSTTNLDNCFYKFLKFNNPLSVLGHSNNPS